MKSNRAIVSSACLSVILAAASVAFSTSADAAVTCRPRIDGEGFGSRVFGQGTGVARENAVIEWSHNATIRFGLKFSNIALAQQVRYDCAGGTVMQAKCVVAGIPCAQTADVPARKGKRKKRRARR